MTTRVRDDLPQIISIELFYSTVLSPLSLRTFSRKIVIIKTSHWIRARVQIQSVNTKYFVLNTVMPAKKPKARLNAMVF